MLRGQHSTNVSAIASEPNFRGKIVDVAELNEWHCLKESEQWLENVDRTHLVLASSKLVQNKKLSLLA